MQEIRIVETQTVAALPGKVKPRGNKPTRDATKKEEEKAKEDIDPLTQIGRALGGH
jgi:hypothetical protein